MAPVIARFDKHERPLAKQSRPSPEHWGLFRVDGFGFSKAKMDLGVSGCSTYQYANVRSFDELRRFDQRFDLINGKLRAKIRAISNKIDSFEHAMARVQKNLKTRSLDAQKFKFRHEFKPKALAKSKSTEQLACEPHPIRSSSQSRVPDGPADMNDVLRFYIQNKAKYKARKPQREENFARFLISSLENQLNRHPEFINSFFSLRLPKRAPLDSIPTLFLPVEPGLYIPLDLGSAGRSPRGGEFPVTQILDLENLEEPVRTVLK